MTASGYALRGLPYYGGKSRHRLGAWIVSLLPTDCDVYVEPYAGMLGVLLQRRPAPLEVANDLDGLITLWWRVVRDQTEQLERWLTLTPYSRVAYDDAQRVIAAPSEHDIITVAGSVSVVLQQGYAPTVAAGATSWRPAHHCVRGRQRVYHQLPDRLAGLAHRLQCVELDQRDACELISRWVDVADAVIYCDPPYADAGYQYGETSGRDHDALLGLLTERPPAARVAVSGYADCAWSELESHGWQRHQLHTYSYVGDGVRTECLWTSYDAPGQTALW